jgi:hypothetical protein
MGGLFRVRNAVSRMEVEELEEVKEGEEVKDA